MSAPRPATPGLQSLLVLSLCMSVLLTGTSAGGCLAYATAEARSPAHEYRVNPRSELTGLTTTVGAGSPTTDPCIYDLNGCLISDGRYFYEYDAWGRLIKVSDRGDATFTATGGLAGGQVGDWLIHYTYDALGRLARLQRPLSGFPGYNHTEHFYYDGARRVQEVFNSIDAGSGSEQSSEEETSTPTLTTWVDREYIHSAGPGSYVDDFVCEIANLATSQTPYFHLQDANYTVVGLVNAAGAVVRQHTFDAYGQLLYAEDLAAAPWSRVGHQGLFLDRLDVPQGNRDLSPLFTPTATPGVYTFGQIDGLYQNRNRTYSPGLQRFVQRDPNGTAMFLLATPTSSSLLIAQQRLGSPPGESSFRDGANLHRYVRNNPNVGADPSGRFFGMAFQIATMAIDAFSTANDTLETARMGVGTALSTHDMVHGYAMGSLMDVVWALSWDMPDDMNSRAGNILGRWDPPPDATAGGGEGPAMAGPAWRPWNNRHHPGGRNRGNAHDRATHFYANTFARQNGRQNTRFNQDLVDGDGTPILREDGRRIRPDVQSIDRSVDGPPTIIDVIEVRHTQSNASIDARLREYNWMNENSGGAFYLRVQVIDVR